MERVPLELLPVGDICLIRGSLGQLVIAGLGSTASDECSRFVYTTFTDATWETPASLQSLRRRLSLIYPFIVNMEVSKIRCLDEDLQRLV